MSAHNKLPRLMVQAIRRIGDVIASWAKERRVYIITYHRVLEHADPLLVSEPDVETFTWQMETLAACFNVLPLHDAIAAIREGRVPPRAVCITFDDGYRSTHDLALPILRRLGLPATVFVTNGYLDEGNMWNDRIVEAVRRLPAGSLDLREFGLGLQQLSGLESRKTLVSQIIQHCKYLPTPGRLAIIGKLEKLAGYALAPHMMMTREMVANLASQGIEIGGHTVSHPILTKLASGSARQEIVENKLALEKITGKPVRLFAYPNGKVGMDFDKSHVQMVQEAGYAAAFTTAAGAASKKNGLFEMPRGRPWDASPLLFSLRLLKWLASDSAEETRCEEHSSSCDGSEETRHNALLIGFHFPPQAESSGVQRMLSFSKHLYEHSWSPSVLSSHPIAYERKDSSQLSELPTTLQVKRAWAIDVKRHLGIRGRYPELLALPDRWMSWWLSAVPLGLALIRKKRMRVIWTTYPIATAHLIGLTLKSLTGKAWVADFRDPMLQDDYPEGKLRRKVFGWIERKTIQRCDAAVFTTHRARDTYVQRYPEVEKHRFHVIENGYDEASFAAVEAVNDPSQSTHEGKITLLHSGVLYSEGRDPSTLFAAIAQLKQLGALRASWFRVVLRAPGDIICMKQLTLNFQVDDLVFVEPPVPYGEALSEMLSVDGLLVFQGASFNTQVPAKVYEYFRARKPVFGLVDPTGETAKVLKDAGCHHIVDINCQDAIAGALVRFLDEIRAGKAAIATNEIVVASSRKHRALQLAQVFNQIALESANR